MVRFLPHKVISFCRKKWSSPEIPEFHQGGLLRTGSIAYLTNEKLDKLIIFGGDSGHPNFMNPFEYDKWLPGHSFPKRIGTLTHTKPKIHRGAEMPPPNPPRSLDALTWAGPNRVGVDCELVKLVNLNEKGTFFTKFFQVGHIKVLNEGEDWNLCQNWKTAPSANIDHFAPSSTQFYCNIHFDLSHFCVYCQWVHQHQFQKFWGNNKLEPTTRSWHWGLKQDDKMGTDIIWKNGNQFNVKQLGTILAIISQGLQLRLVSLILDFHNL